MECYYHPGRESTDNCAICGKSICKECGLEIAGKIYCKECLEKIVGIGIENKAEAPETQVERSSAYPEQERKPITETIYETQYDEKEYTPQDNQIHETKPFIEDSPYNIRNNLNQNITKNETPQSREFKTPQNEYNITHERIDEPSQNYIYPNHNLNQQANVEDKYEKYLDDLYYDENEIPLDEQLAKDEEEYGSLTHRPYHPRSEEAIEKEKLAEKPKMETPEEMEARIRAEILAESKGNIRDSNIHNLKYQDEKEPMNAVDIVLTIVLIIVVLIVVYYIIYILTLQFAYPTFMDAIYGLSNPQNVINNILSPPQWNIFIVNFFFKLL